MTGKNFSEGDICEVSRDFVRWTWCIIAPIIVTIGLLGNILVVVVFSRLGFARSSTLLHLFVLAINDSIVLCVGPVRYWTDKALNYDLRTTSEFGCKLNFFVVYVTVDYSAWILVSITVERAFSVVKPLHVRRWFTVRRATFRLGVIFLVLTGINMHYFFTNGLIYSTEDGSANGTQHVVCDSISKEFKDFEDYVFVWIDLCFASLFPFLIMAICNCIIIASLRKTVRNQPRSIRGRKGANSASPSHHDQLIDISMSEESQSEMADLSRSQDAHQLAEPLCSELQRSKLPCPELPCSESPRPSGIGLQDVSQKEDEPLALNPLSRVNHLPPSSELETRESSVTSVTFEKTQVCSRNSSATPIMDGTCSRPSVSRRQSKPPPKAEPVISTGVTRTLVFVTVVFVLTTLPNALYFIVDTFVYDRSKETVAKEKVECFRTNAIMDIASLLTNVLMYTNYGSNFLLYSARSDRFRKELRNMFRQAAKRIQAKRFWRNKAIVGSSHHFQWQKSFHNSQNTGDSYFLGCSSSLGHNERKSVLSTNF